MKHYTFNLTCSFNMQFTFSDREVAQDTDGGKGDFEPTEEALFQLAEELREHLEKNFSALDVQIFADSRALLGVSDDTTPTA